MKEKVRFLGLDVHAETIAVAVAEQDGEVRSLGTIANREESIRKLVKKLGPVEQLRACYEAGPTGYVLYWQLTQLGVECAVVAPTLVPVRLHPIARLHRNQRGRHHCALHPQLRQLPVQYVASRTGFIAGPQLLHRTKLLHQLADRLFPVGDCSQAAYLAVLLGYRDGNRLGMDIQSQKSYLLFHDRSFPLVALNCASNHAQPNPRLAHRNGHSIMTYLRIMSGLPVTRPK